MTTETPEERRLRQNRNAANSRQRKRDRGEANDAPRKWRLNNPKSYLLVNAKSRARIKGLPFDLTEDDFELPELCPVFGTPMRTGTRIERDNAPSLDRKIPELGYVKGNVCVISWRANKLKNNGTREEFVRLLDWITQTEETGICTTS